MSGQSSELAREVAEKWIGPEHFAPAMASGMAAQMPPTTMTFTIEPHSVIVDKLATLIDAALTRYAAQVRLEEARWWQPNVLIDCISAELWKEMEGRLAELARAAGQESG